ncbi:Formyltetrahydrofolate deformylase [Marinobacterium lacunae]|uniref:Formyltetrahydrofolate deformylase n=1 Tax=Marinobacterium lacunae TaxID=1232683 RepID=A0A081G066_9GAMM|nr:formyltetrahydrofolate deformylase [Marinobacterium lacunae]KEA64171.1 Formyltetrahydrofolate deformylase [Marinobacterium lacunae]MBR9885386.1 formyltetrahydrofolate deformylase [Oceanospirillales bacterium]
MALDPQNTRRYRISISCPDTFGIVAAVTQFIAQYKGWISEAHQFADPEACTFFMRYEVVADSLPFDLDTFKEKFAPLAEQFNMTWNITDSAERKRAVLMVSKEAHCLSDLLYRWRSGELNIDIPCVISNHDDLRSYVEWHGIPYVHVPVDMSNKEPHFQAVREQIAAAEADVIVLAKYMQIIPEELCEIYPNRIINIHHSFLPSFIGARPYHQAAERGVKQIGATCHYVTSELDAGPIIEQDVQRVTHHNTTKDMVRLGKDVEKAVLARGLRFHIEDRVLVYGNKTVVFA